MEYRLVLHSKPIIPLFHSSSIPNQPLYSTKKGKMGRLNLSLFKQENCSLERTEGKGQGDGFFQSILRSFCFGKKSNVSIVHFALHGDGRSFFFQERETQDEKGSKIGKGP